MKKLASVLLLLIAPTLHAALPPLYQTLAEYKALIESPELPTHLQSGDAIESIILQEDQLIVKTNKRTLVAKIHYEPQSMPGPARFTLEFQQAEPLKQ